MIDDVFMLFYMFDDKNVQYKIHKVLLISSMEGITGSVIDMSAMNLRAMRVVQFVAMLGIVP